MPWVPYSCRTADQWRVVLLRTLRQQVNLRQNPYPHLDTALPLSWISPELIRAAKNTILPPPPLPDPTTTTSAAPGIAGALFCA